MTADDDLIRRGDVREIAADAVKRAWTDESQEIANKTYDAIAAIPAVQPAPDAPAEDATAKGETAGQMLDRLGMDGAKWAAEFRTTALRLGYSDMDEGWLIGWFANAIMAGYDRKPAPDLTPYVRADLHRAEVEAAVKRAFEAAVTRAEKYTECCQSCAGVGASIRALASDRAALARIIDEARK